jgi:hypothetical protein
MTPSTLRGRVRYQEIKPEYPLVEMSLRERNEGKARETSRKWTSSLQEDSRSLFNLQAIVVRIRCEGFISISSSGKRSRIYKQRDLKVKTRSQCDLLFGDLSINLSTLLQIVSRSLVLSLLILIAGHILSVLYQLLFIWHQDTRMPAKLVNRRIFF